MGRGRVFLAWTLLAPLAGLAALPDAQRRWPAQAIAEADDAPSPALSPIEAARTFVLPPGYHVDLVASEPLVVDPIAIEFDPDGRLWVLEMPGFMSGPGATHSREPINSLVVLDDRDADGVMDTRTPFAEGLVLPRAFKILDRGVLVAEPPNLWLMTDADGDLRADRKELIDSTYGRPAGTVEHNANSLFWALDNVMYTAEHDWHLRLKNGVFEILPAPNRGQWGVSMDDAGRIFRNFNDAPLFADFLAARYYARNPEMARTRGLYEPLIAREDSTIWPIRPTRGVNRGYRDQFFRPDGTSVTIQGVGSPVIYRGDQLPAELYGDAFITDSTTNLVHRYRIVDDGSGRLRAVDGYPKGEILASTDERFRPVNLAPAPDGTLYVVDMYRGVVQETVYWTEYLREYVHRRQLERPVHLGRIWRIRHDSSRRVARPALSRATAPELVETLSHANGWWRDTAQRLLVERGARSEATRLEQLTRSASDWRTRLHAAWTLDGLDALSADAVSHMLGDPSADVRASAVRLSERWLREEAHPLRTAVMRLADDPSWTVRRQVAATLGEIQGAAGIKMLLDILRRYGPDDAVTVDAAMSGLRGREREAFAAVQAWGSPRHADALSMLAAAMARRGEIDALQHVVARAGDAGSPAWERRALLQGLDLGLSGGGGRAGAGAADGGGGRAAAVRGTKGSRSPRLPAAPKGLSARASAGDDEAALARRVLAKLDWPGKPVVGPKMEPLTAVEEKRFAAGAALYATFCAPCHQPDGRGREKLAPSLVDSPYVLGPDAGAAARILLAGKEGPTGLMPPLGAALNDEQMAAVLTFIRREWGNTGSPISAGDVAEIRGLTKFRARPWTDAELQRVR